MAWLRWFVCSMGFAAIALLHPGDALTHNGGDRSCPRGSTIAHPHDCQKYLACAGEELLLLTCTEEMYYEEATGECTFDKPPSCSQRKEDMEPIGETYLGRRVVDPCDNYRPGFKLPHPDDCGRFYQCTQEGSALFRCPANLLFHAILKVCVWPQQVVCEPGSGGQVPLPPPPPPSPTPPTTTTTIDGGADDDTAVEICEPSCTLDYRCPLDCYAILPKVFPHPSRCDAYYQCNPQGYSCERQCPVGMWFSSIFQRCVYAELSECVPINRPICQEPNCLPHPECPEIDTDPPTMLPGPSVNEYYICRDGSACAMTCPPGLEWIPGLNVCDFPPMDTETPPTDEPETPTDTEPATTTTTEPETTTTTEPETTTTTEPETTTTTEPETTTTTEPETTTTTVPETTTTTEPETTTTTVPETTTTTEPETTTTTVPETTTTTVPETTTTTEVDTPTTPEVDCPTCAPSNCVPDSRCPLCENCVPTFFPHADCDMFYKCSHGLICEMKCPPGLHFNVRENVCDWPMLAGCEGPPITVAPPQDAVCHPNPNCPRYDSVDVFLPHPNCGLYYKCSWGNACLKECPQGLHWSMAQNRCEWPFLAGCDPNLPPYDPECPTCPCLPCRSNRNACHPSKRCPPTWMMHVTANFGHEQSCSQFYECLSGQACVLECPAGLEYSGGSGRCDHPSNAMCALQRY